MKIDSSKANLVRWISSL